MAADERPPRRGGYLAGSGACRRSMPSFQSLSTLPSHRCSRDCLLDSATDGQPAHRLSADSRSAADQPLIVSPTGEIGAYVGVTRRAGIARQPSDWRRKRSLAPVVGSRGAAPCSNSSDDGSVRLSASLPAAASLPASRSTGCKIGPKERHHRASARLVVTQFVGAGARRTHPGGNPRGTMTRRFAITCNVTTTSPERERPSANGAPATGLNGNGGADHGNACSSMDKKPSICQWIYQRPFMLGRALKATEPEPHTVSTMSERYCAQAIRASSLRWRAIEQGLRRPRIERTRNGPSCSARHPSTGDRHLWRIEAVLGDPRRRV
jgi:hypothetical protein